MSTESILRATLGGIAIGFAAALALIVHGRIAGISGTLGRALDRDRGSAFRIAFLGGLLLTGLVLARIVPTRFGGPVASIPTLMIAGFLVGMGTTISNGCTSGHGVCGISRGSLRSLVAVATFMTTGAITVAVVGALR